MAITPQTQNFSYGCPNIADFFDLCFHWVSVVRVTESDRTTQSTSTWNFFFSAKVQETVSMSRRLAYRR